ncbi:MAG: DNA polymerase III subunit delta [Actinobacteria bacterium HGW-Actinobacteria-7]|nr:MAG: DNA polymerase III subunit delta [Actinobacteria bacterium HGW-Actinobacteria-7]
MPRCAWDDIVGQPRVTSFLRTVAEAGRVGHAYLFVGPPGGGKKTAALALACALFCGDNGCGGCPACSRIRRRVHPDVRIITPEGTAGYLKDQIDDVIHDVQLAPIEGPYKVYIFESADLFNDKAANAFLKTLEEPPADVVIILLAHTYERVIPTIASRCQVVRFRRIPPSEATAVLVAQSGADPAEAAAALAAVGGVVARARDFLASPSRRAARDVILRSLKDLSSMDEYDVLVAAKELLTAVKAPLDEVKQVQAAELAARTEFMGKGSTRSIEERHKRELTAREREGVAEVLNVAESWLRDCLTLSQGVGDLAVNIDALDAMEEVGAVITPGAAASALGAVNEARRRISYNVTPQLAVEAMLFDLREVLRCPR